MIVHCAKCDHTWNVAIKLPMQIRRTVQAMKGACALGCPECGAFGKSVLMGASPKVPQTPEGNPIAWLAGYDTGVSSRTIWFVMMNQPQPREDWHGVPHDPDDFGRCYRLLKLMPTWRGRLREVSTKYKKWSGLVEHWDELTALYEEELPAGMAPKLYARIKELISEDVE